MRKILLFVLLLTISACNNNHKNLDDLNRVDVHQNAESWMVLESAELDKLRATFQSIEWSDGPPRLEEPHDTQLTLFFLYDKNMPERLVDYFVWTEPQQVIIWDKEENRLGTLSQSESEKLLSIIEQKEDSIHTP